MDLPTTHYDQPQGAKETKETKETKSPDTKNSETKTTTSSSKKIKFETISLYAFLTCVLFSPLVFFPSLYAPLDLVKTVFLSILILISAIAYVLSILKNKATLLPRSALAYVSIGIIISMLISSVLSAHFSKTFMGQGFEMGTMSFIFLMFLSSFLVNRMVMKDREVVFKIYTAILISFIVLAIFHIIRLFGGAGILSLGFLSTLTSTPLGKWYDLASLAGVAGLLSFLGMKFLPLGKNLKGILIVALVVCGSVLFVINFSLVWYALAFVLLCFGIYEYVTKTRDSMKGIMSRISIFTLILFIIAITCAWKGDVLSVSLTRSLKIEYGEAILPWQLTLDVTSDTLKESPFFGAGSNRFGFQYLRFKPLEVNQTPFWNSEFSSGYATLPTFVATQGFIGLILWCLFFIFFVRDGIRALRKASDSLKTFLTTSSFFTASFLWIVSLTYIPSHVIIFLTFVFTGICTAVALGDGASGVVFARISRYKKFSPVFSAIAGILLIIWLGAYGKTSVAVSYFQKGIKELNVNSAVDVAQKDFEKALFWNTSDIYYQALSEINILKINALTQDLQNSSTQNPGAPLDQKKVEQVVSLANQALGYTKSAEKLDSSNYYNYISEARISEIAASLKIPKAYENAKNSYLNALKTNPYNPAIYLNLARLEASQNKLIDAEQYVGKALQLKQNYTEAVYLLSQVQVANGQLKDAITSAKVATEITPTEAILFFQLGILEYNDKNYSDAVTALEKAVSLNAQYANAKYFLGLSYARLGRNEDAILQFEDLAKTNADNKEVVFILSNLKAGKSPFTDVKPPIDNKPEKRKTLPVVEKKATTNAK